MGFININLSSRQKLFLTAAIFLAGAVFWVWLWIGFLYRVKNAGATLQDLKGQIPALEEKRKLAGEMQALFKNRTGDLEKIRSFLISKDRPVVFIESLEELARKTRNRIAINFDEGKSKDQNLFFRLTLEGGEENVLKYLQLLELMPYKLKVEEVSIQKLTSAGGRAYVSIPAESGILLSHRLTVLIQVEGL